MGFSRQGYWSGLLCPPPGAPPDPGTEPGSLTQAGRCFTAEPPGKPRHPPGKLLFLPPHCLWEAPQGPRLKRHSAWLALPHTLPAFSHYLLHLGGSLDHASESRSVVSDSLRPLDCSPPGSSVHGSLQARILEWAAMPSSRGSSQPRDQSWVSCIAGGFLTM